MDIILVLSIERRSGFLGFKSNSFLMVLHVSFTCHRCLHIGFRGRPPNPKHHKRKMGHHSNSKHTKQTKELIPLLPNDQIHSNYIPYNMIKTILVLASSPVEARQVKLRQVKASQVKGKSRRGTSSQGILHESQVKSRYVKLRQGTSTSHV